MSRPARATFACPTCTCRAASGARYDTPVGPIRLDIGYRIQPLQVLGYANEDEAARADPTLGTPPKLFGIPMAIALGIGEAY